MFEDVSDNIGLFYCGTKTFHGGEALLPEERGFVARACEKRIRDFATGRHCAREALGGLGFARSPIPMAPSRAPVWPSGVTGSITHTEGYAAAVVGSKERVMGVGVDAQSLSRKITPGMETLILTKGDADFLARSSTVLSREEKVHLAFCVKESLYKCINPLLGRFFGFDAAEMVSYSPKTGEFVVRLNKDLVWPAGTEFSGSYILKDGVVASLLAIEQGASSRV